MTHSATKDADSLLCHTHALRRTHLCNPPRGEQTPQTTLSLKTPGPLRLAPNTPCPCSSRWKFDNGPLPWSSKACVNSWPITTPMPPKFKALVDEECQIRGRQGHILIPFSSSPSSPTWPQNPDPPASDTLWVVVSIEGGLQDASWEYDFILGWKVVSVHGLRCHAPPGGGRTWLRVLTLLMLPSLTAQACPACLLQGP